MHQTLHTAADVTAALICGRLTACAVFAMIATLTGIAVRGILRGDP